MTTTTATPSPEYALIRKETHANAETSATFPLFKSLPPELRNMVYASLFSDHPTIKPSQRHDTPIPIPILLADKQLHDEAHTVLASTAVVAITISFFKSWPPTATERNALLRFQRVRFDNAGFGPRDLAKYRLQASSTSYQLAQMLQALNARLVTFVSGSAGLARDVKRYAEVDVRNLFWVLELGIAYSEGMEGRIVERERGSMERGIGKLRERVVEEWVGCLWTMRGDEHTEWTVVKDAGMDARKW
ncbi:uncharacterized protein BDZ99DRAFT_528447 [Mytilinidion resinicola]|uniref:Uncharacterized protein n=1 Tax=Mytilinidion resinicola TaxID=574789 RepID=A0A6A6XYK2_9PEZI|nr:uncharacterized protein BDZ99DRAFT_528447 [Mytilinidion resinicola]KAF2801500.1 hypothetical protein BDZ99DRAFT_528447 [Mytilinidion resinicola]